jgi:hypothetical protein
MAKSKFWSDPTITPKRAFKFLVSLGTGERQLPSFVCKKVTKPSFDITETPHKFLNHTFYFPGRLEWQTIDLTAVDPLTPDASAIIAEILSFSGYNVPDDQIAAQSMLNRANSIAALGNVIIQQIGGIGGAAGADVIEQWELKNAWVKSVKYGELSYESDDMVNIDMTLRYDFAVKTK